MTFIPPPRNAHRTRAAVVSALGLTLALTACSSSAPAPGGEAATVDPDAKVTLTILAPAGPHLDLANAYAEAFHAEHDNITIKVESSPTGSEGENVVKTRLATGEMTDIFIFNSGSLLESLNPDKSLVDLSAQPYMSDLTDDFTRVVSGDEGVYGVPWGTSRAGGIVYNKDVYADLGLTVPKTWDEFMANNKKVAEAKLTPVVQTYGDAFTAQILVLGDFANVIAEDKDWATEFTKNNRKFADRPALSSFEKLSGLANAGSFNKDFASAKYDEGIRQVASGEAAHFPMLTNYVTTNLAANHPELADKVGLFAVPSNSAKESQLTTWMPLAAYIPKTIEPSNLAAAQTFLGYVASPAGCAVYAEVASPAGPYVVKGCELPDSALPLVADVASYVDAGNSSPALEFLSPVKGTNLAQIAVEVGSKMSDAAKAAANYDNDVAKQAKQLGLEGW